MRRDPLQSTGSVLSAIGSTLSVLSRIAAIVGLACALLSMDRAASSTGVTPEQEIQAAQAVPHMELVAENDHLALYINRSTTEIAVLDKASGDLWFSNPPNREKEETIARGTEKQRLSALLSLKFYDSSQRLKTLDSFNHSVQYGQFEVSSIPNGVRIRYTLGRKWNDGAALPLMISEERFRERILDRLDEKGQKQFLDRYTLIRVVKDDQSVTGGIKARVKGTSGAMLESRINSVFEDYTVEPGDETYRNNLTNLQNLRSQLEDLRRQARDDDANDEIRNLENRIYQLEDTLGVQKANAAILLLNTIRNNRSGVSEISDIKPEDLYYLRDAAVYVQGQMPAFVQRDLDQLIKLAGYTAEDAQEDHTSMRIEGPHPRIDVFGVTVEYVLDDDNLVVVIPGSELEYPVHVWDAAATPSGRYVTLPIVSLTVMEFFGAAGPGQCDYIFVPDGCGALIRPDHTRASVPAFSVPVYGVDNTLPVAEKPIEPGHAYLPVYGMKQGDRAVLAIIEDGEALATVRAYCQGMYNSYSVVFSEFTTMAVEQLPCETHFEQGVLNLYPPRCYQGDYRIRYAFLHGDEASYVGMALYYQDYLVGTHGLSRQSSRSSVPFFLELIGAIPVKSSVMGIPIHTTYALTTCEEAAKIVDLLSQAGVSDIKLRYSGWLAGGTEHDFPLRARVDQRVGGSKALESLRLALMGSGAELYPEVRFLTVYETGLFDGLNISRDVSRRLRKVVAQVHTFDLATGQPKEGRDRYILSPSRLEWLVDSFMDSFEHHGIRQICLADLGNEINSDFRVGSAADGSYIDRQQAATMINGVVSGISQNGYSVMVEGANAALIPYADCVVGVPTASSGRDILFEDVPFMQIVLRSLVDYAGEPINMSGDYRIAFLKALETGSGLCFRWSYRPAPTRRSTEAGDLYSLHYTGWIESALGMYREAQSVLSEIAGRKIIQHEKLADGVYRTTYDDCGAVVVNYNNDSATVDGLSVSGRGYLWLKGVADQ